MLANKNRLIDVRSYVSWTADLLMLAIVVSPSAIITSTAFSTTMTTTPQTTMTPGTVTTMTTTPPTTQTTTPPTTVTETTMTTTPPTTETTTPPTTQTTMTTTPPTTISPTTSTSSVDSTAVPQCQDIVCYNGARCVVNPDFSESCVGCPDGFAGVTCAIGT